MAKFLEYIAELRRATVEVPIEPPLKANQLQQDKQIREEQDLAHGAVLIATLEEGSTDQKPVPGDLVYVHYSVRTHQDEVLYSTRSSEGGSGQAFALLLEKGLRAPRAWEIALKDMCCGQRCMLKVAPGYGFLHPESRMPPPCDLPLQQELVFELTLVSIYPAAQVQQFSVPVPLPPCSTASGRQFSRHLQQQQQQRQQQTEEGSTDLTMRMDAMYKHVIKEATTLETPRPPNEVTLHVSCYCPSYDGIMRSGRSYFSTAGSAPLTLQMGQGALPPGLEDALSWMSKGESAVYILPAEVAAPEPSDRQAAAPQPVQPLVPLDTSDSADESASARISQQELGAASSSALSSGRPAGCLLPAPPERCRQVEVYMEVVGVVQVRDVTGTGEVLKRRVCEGQGEFPIDCPLHDTTVRVHYRARPYAAAPLAADAATLWAYDSRAATGGTPLEVDTGCGELPEGLELCIKLMTPGEVSTCTARGRYGYQGRDDVPEPLAQAYRALVGTPPASAIAVGGAGAAVPAALSSSDVEFEVELVDFDKEGFWQHLAMEERFQLADRIKAKGNALYKQNKHKYARARYERLLRLLESTRDFEQEEDVQRTDAYKLAVMGNLVLCCMGMAEYAEAARLCEKALEYDPDNAKLLFRLGKALSIKGDYEDAEAILNRVREVDPDASADVTSELAANKARCQAAAQKQKQQFRSFFDKKR